MKTVILLWLAFSAVTTAARWAAFGRWRVPLVMSAGITLLCWLLAGPISEVSDRQIRAFFDQDHIRNTILAVVTIESVLVSLFFWKSMNEGRHGMIDRTFGLIAGTPTLAFVPAILLAVHEVLSKWNSVDFGQAALGTSVVACMSGCTLAVAFVTIFESESARKELAALVSLAFLPWSAIVMGWVRIGRGDFRSSSIEISTAEASPAFWTLAIGLPFLGFFIRRHLDSRQERRLG